MGKRLNVVQLSQKKYTLVEGLSEELIDAIGHVEDTFTAIIYGGSGNGKTNFLVRLLKELKPVGDMLYISYEEAHGKTIQDLILRHDLVNQLPNLRFSDGETFEELLTMLRKKKSPKVIVLDSWQFSGLTLANYLQLKKEFVFGKTPGKRKIFLIISHVQGSQPDGKTAIEIKRDANIKIHVKNFIAIVETSRYGSRKNMVIWEQGAKHNWGKDYKKMTAYKDGTKATSTKPKPERSSKTTVSILPPETDEDVEAAMLEALKSGRQKA
jgi:hypothetical protein